MYYADVIKKFKTKPKKLWEILNGVNCKVKKTNSIKEVYNGDLLTSNDKEIAQAFNDHFSRVGSDVLCSDQSEYTSFCNKYVILDQFTL
jgi:hypothetical protein